MRARLVAAAVIAWTAAGVTGAPAHAQDRPTVFLHGLGSSGSDWAATAARLRTMVAIEPRLPDLPWNSEFATQAQRLQTDAAYATLPKNTVAVGHSNGGVVAREWNKTHKLDGIVTLGTPHGGAPILLNLQNWATMSRITQAAIGRVAGAFNAWSDWIWVYPFVDSALRWLSDFNIWSAVNLGAAIGVQAGAPVVYQMLPGSPYLATLNGGANLSREANHLLYRLGIASIAHNFFYAGPARAIAPDLADELATLMYSSASALLLWGNYLLVSASPTDVSAMDQALSLTNLAFQVLSIDPYYCRMVSTLDLSQCTANDGIVPLDSQVYPGATNILIGTQNDGPAHKQQKQRSDDALFVALTNYMHLPARTTPAPAPVPAPAPAPTPPAPGQDPSPDPGPSRPDPNPRTGPVAIVEWLEAGMRLGPDDCVDSSDGQMHLLYQLDGNLVLYDGNWRPLWATGTVGTRPGVVVMQADGNFVVYDANGIPLWAASGSFGHPGAHLAVQNDGNVVIYDVDGVPLWNTGTFVR